MAYPMPDQTGPMESPMGQGDDRTRFSSNPGLQPQRGGPRRPLAPVSTRMGPVGLDTPQPIPVGGTMPTTTPMAPTYTPPPQRTQTPTGPGAGVGLQPTDPNNPLTDQTIVPGQMADRYAIAQQRWDQFAKSTAPAYQAALRDANRYGAATGRLNSGSLRTDFGNLANQRNLQLQDAQSGFLNDALENSIGDAWRGIDLAQQQQGFQNTQQEQAWQRYLDQLGAGSESNPYNARMDQSQMYGQQGLGALGALSQYWRTRGKG